MPNSEDDHRTIFELQSLGRRENVDIMPSWRSLFAFTTRKHSPTVLLALLSTVISSLTKPAAAIFFGNIFTELTRYGAGTITIQVAVQQISKWCAAMAMLGLAAWFAEGIFLYTWMLFGELQAKSIREKMFTGLLDKNMEWYDLRSDGIGALLIRIQT